MSSRATLLRFHKGHQGRDRRRKIKAKLWFDSATTYAPSYTIPYLSSVRQFLVPLFLRFVFVLDSIFFPN
ncbi:hypothetical protein RchiOBHm_Chr1g0329721 [Rosa chinensis]|uniref:Uncharacterized protein n=1 Tax=Rosa chinensis TaxID=74649 RepID=A0A2P6SB69_ROSCH|nr:hypothetical protein RchiOBHm_Chr1g0329721 [Rosa chinensis]